MTLSIPIYLHGSLQFFADVRRANEPSSALPVAEASEAPAGSPPHAPDAGASAVQGSN